MPVSSRTIRRDFNAHHKVARGSTAVAMAATMMSQDGRVPCGGANFRNPSTTCSSSE
jgi:hypothetical protein